MCATQCIGPHLPVMNFGGMGVALCQYLTIVMDTPILFLFKERLHFVLHLDIIRTCQANNA